MREIRSYGSVRGVAGDRYPYRDPSKNTHHPQTATQTSGPPLCPCPANAARLPFFVHSVHKVHKNPPHPHQKQTTYPKLASFRRKTLTTYHPSPPTRLIQYTGNNVTTPIHILGGGLAGSEAAWQIAEAGHPAVLHEMRPVHPTAAHQTDRLAELVCSNSLKSEQESSAPWLLKQELRRLGSLVLRCADTARVPGGHALTVDRDIFAAEVTRAIIAHPRIELRREEIREIPNILAGSTGS